MMIFIYYVMERQRRQLKSFDQCRYICYVCCSDILISLYDFVCKNILLFSLNKHDRKKILRLI